VNIQWNSAKAFCEWLNAKTGKEWRLPTNAEWEAAVGTTTFPWGDYYPPKWDDGNYKILENGKDDPQKMGLDGIKGTAPVGSFKSNFLGFYDLGGNVWEWMWDSDQNDKRMLRGACWYDGGNFSRSSFRFHDVPWAITGGYGLRLVRRSGL